MPNFDEPQVNAGPLADEWWKLNRRVNVATETLGEARKVMKPDEILRHTHNLEVLGNRSMITGLKYCGLKMTLEVLAKEFKIPESRLERARMGAGNQDPPPGKAS